MGMNRIAKLKTIRGKWHDKQDYQNALWRHGMCQGVRSDGEPCRCAAESLELGVCRFHLDQSASVGSHRERLKADVERFNREFEARREV